MGDLALPAGMKFIELPFVCKHSLECYAVSIRGNPVVCFEIDGIRIGFYQSPDDPNVNWRPIVGGIGADLSFNEGTHQEIINYYNSGRLAEAAAFLNTHVGDLRTNVTLPIVDDDIGLLLKNYYNHNVLCPLTKAENESVHLPTGYYERLASRVDMAAANNRLTALLGHISKAPGDKDQALTAYLANIGSADQENFFLDLDLLGFDTLLEGGMRVVPSMSALQSSPNIEKIIGEQRNVELEAKIIAWNIVRKNVDKSVMVKGVTQDTAMVFFATNEETQIENNPLLGALDRLRLSYEVAEASLNGENPHSVVVIKGRDANTIIEHMPKPVYSGWRYHNLRVVPG